MKSLCSASIIVVATLVIAGCSTSKKVQQDDSAAAQADTTKEIYTQAIHVFVDGDDLGTIPMTVRVRRGFGTREVKLWQAGEDIRIYEIEFDYTAEGRQAAYGFWSSESSDGVTYDVRHLPTSDEHTFIVPYSPAPTRVDDHQYGVTLLVHD